MPSFDVVSKLSLHEVENAVSQAQKELTTRYDFQGTQSSVTLGADKGSALLQSSSEERLSAAYEVLLTRLAKRGVSLRSIEPGKVEHGGLNVVRQNVVFRQGIPAEKAKELIALLKREKRKVTASIQGDQLRVSGKNRDDLQDAIALMRGEQDRLQLELQFTNFRD